MNPPKRVRERAEHPAEAPLATAHPFAEESA
jgi:hypothetical protein